MRLVRDKPIHYRGKQIGIIKVDRTYITFRSKEHWFRKYNGFGLSSSVLEELRKYDVIFIKIIYKRVDDTQEVYITETRNFYEKGVVYKDNADYQRVLNIKEFSKVVAE